MCPKSDATAYFVSWVFTGNALPSRLGQDRRQGSGVGLRDFTVVGGGMSLLEKQSTQVREISGVKGSPWIPVGSGGSPTTSCWVPPLWGLFGSPVLYDRGSEITGSRAVNSNLLVPQQATDVFLNPQLDGSSSRMIRKWTMRRATAQGEARREIPCTDQHA